MIWLSLPILIISLFFIAMFTDRMIRYTLTLSKAFGLSEMAAGFILLSVSTSLPELAVSTMASISNEGKAEIDNYGKKKIVRIRMRT